MRDMEAATPIKSLSALAFVPAKDVANLSEGLSQSFPDKDPAASYKHMSNQTALRGPLFVAVAKILVVASLQGCH